MTEAQLIEKFHESLVPQKSLKSTIKKRKRAHMYESVPPELVSRYESDGWEIDKEYKTKVKMKKLKPFGSYPMRVMV